MAQERSDHFGRVFHSAPSELVYGRQSSKSLIHRRIYLVLSGAYGGRLVDSGILGRKTAHIRLETHAQNHPGVPRT